MRCPLGGSGRAVTSRHPLAPLARGGRPCNTGSEMPPPPSSRPSAPSPVAPRPAAAARGPFGLGAGALRARPSRPSLSAARWSLGSLAARGPSLPSRSEAVSGLGTRCVWPCLGHELAMTHNLRPCLDRSGDEGRTAGSCASTRGWSLKAGPALGDENRPGKRANRPPRARSVRRRSLLRPDPRRHRARPARSLVRDGIGRLVGEHEARDQEPGRAPPEAAPPPPTRRQAHNDGHRRLLLLPPPRWWP